MLTAEVGKMWLEGAAGFGLAMVIAVFAIRFIIGFFITEGYEPSPKSIKGLSDKLDNIQTLLEKKEEP